MNSKNNNIVTVILTIIMALSFSACQSEEPLDAPVAKDALALLPADTPVGIQAQLKGGFAQGESRTEATNWYASNEIHPTKDVVFYMYLPGAADPNKTILGTNGHIPFGSLTTTEPFSSLKLKDFNLTEGGDRCVSRWTALMATYSGWDNLFGFARLKADAQGNPVLDFGDLKRADTKVTLVLKDEKGDPICLNDYSKVSAELSFQESSTYPIYTPEGETQAISFSDYLTEIKTLKADEAIDPTGFGWTADATGLYSTADLSAMRNADGTEKYYGEQNNMLTAIVCPTPTHKDNNDNTFTPIEGGPQLTDDDKLIIKVKQDPDGNGPLTTGTYTLKLKDVMVTENGQQKPLTALKSGEHLTLTVTLQHNMLVQATATIGGWNEVSADVDLNQDPSFIPNSTNP